MDGVELPSWLARAFGIAAVVVLVALGAHVKLFMPGNPVPVTLQTFFVLLAGAMLGPRDGMIAVICYITVEIVGGPVFALGPGGVARGGRPLVARLTPPVPSIPSERRASTRGGWPIHALVMPLHLLGNAFAPSSNASAPP
jgi:hypothetical protein